jgi:formate dehydrogenase assembly factor FdhD
MDIMKWLRGFFPSKRHQIESQKKVEDAQEAHHTVRLPQPATTAAVERLKTGAASTGSKIRPKPAAPSISRDNVTPINRDRDSLLDPMNPLSPTREETGYVHIAYLDQNGNLLAVDSDRIRGLLDSIPTPPVGKKLLLIYAKGGD